MLRDLRKLPTDRVLVSPSVLASDFSCLGGEIDRAAQAGADVIHLDVMDGGFVPNLSFGPPVIRSIRPKSELLFDTHLMIKHPAKYAAAFAKAGADHLTFHLECSDPAAEVMTVEPGFGGQSFMADQLPKIAAIKREILRRKLHIQLEADGGLDERTVIPTASHGANLIVAGTSVFRHPEGMAEAIHRLHAATGVLDTQL